MSNFELPKLKKEGCLQEPQLSYHEIVAYLDNHWTQPIPGASQKIDSLIGSPALQLPSIVIAGTNGKSTTIYYLTKLLRTEGLKIGTFTSPHFNFYHERIAINEQIISHDTFTALANTIFALINTHRIVATSKDILMGMALLHFKNEQVDLAIFEQENMLAYDPVSLCRPHILGITRMILPDKESVQNAIQNLLKPLSNKTQIASADQSKITLQKIAHAAQNQGNAWIMPIRKIAPLPYPYEQLHGRCAALAERIAQTYINQILPPCDLSAKTSLLRIVKKQRNRPYLTSKQYINVPHKTTEQFWKTINPEIISRFQKIEHKHYTLILDTAANIDALQNLLLGIRLLNYEKPFKSIYFLLAAYEGQFNEHEFIKTVRYFFKKMSGQFAFYPITNTIGEQTGTTFDIEKFNMTIQHAKIKVVVYKNFKNAFETTIKQLHDPQDLLVITGSQAIISEYWKYKKSKDS